MKKPVPRMCRTAYGNTSMPKEKLKPCLLEDDIALLFPEYTQEMLDKILDCPHRRADQPDKAVELAAEKIMLYINECIDRDEIMVRSKIIQIIKKPPANAMTELSNC